MADQTVVKIATRESYGNALKELAEEFPDLVVLDADPPLPRQVFSGKRIRTDILTVV